MNPQQYPASQVEPGWQLLINEQWVDVGVVVETETPDGARYLTFVFDENAKLPAVKLRKTALILARPPHQPSSGAPEP